MKIIILTILILIFCGVSYSQDLWKISAYCSCKICCKKYADGITASGKQVKQGMVACNWLNFGTVLYIEGLGVYTVEDRGNVKYFGTKKEQRKSLDIYFDTHEEATNFGVKYKKVEIIKGD